AVFQWRGGTKLWVQRGDFFLLVPAFAILALVSSQTGMNHHVRYTMPALPFLFVWCSQVANVRSLMVRGVAYGALGLSVISSLTVFPFSLSYFNEAAGGPRRGQEHLLDSNIDWGQDLLYLREWIERQSVPGPIYLAHFGYFDPGVLGIEFTLP